METRIEDLKITTQPSSGGSLRSENSRFDWCNIIYVFGSVMLASNAPLHIKPAFLPALLNDRTVKLALMVTFLFSVIRLFTSIFFSSDGDGVPKPLSRTF